MRLIYATDYKDMCRKAANLISAQVILYPNSVLGLATGATPIGIYDQLADWYRKRDLDFSGVTSVNLDEYCGLEAAHKQSYRYFMETQFFSKINIQRSRTHVPNGIADPDEECRRYDEVIHTLGGIDLQLLGLGHNGHIGFNEPGPLFQKGTHCVELSENTRQANRRFFAHAEEVPHKAITVGMSSIMQAKRVILAVSGKQKANILKKAIEGPVTPEIPASLLQLHNDLIVVASVDQ